jgi:hypothetical protein
MAGKGDKPRSCFSKLFKDNYDEIDWGTKKGQRNYKRNPRSVLKNKLGIREQQSDSGRDNRKRPFNFRKKS